MNVNIAPNIVYKSSKAIILLIGGEYCVEYCGGKKFLWFDCYRNAVYFAENKI